ncbi:hypothetical protein SISSUDRAFT_637872 [Sistotremastrum suecicum HHB10207 ss-3]|uniref:Uncharacterized protein n=1 Tax=Sistotremastrum suecicum HHB10207 ss-3 TaxID=1314776 RepID=A0A165X744_9AGAM|nr:hypothetical protein SISSUDRAFT_637872 [Sistotremastrum suecicum HHB10207 ss-3]
MAHEGESGCRHVMKSLLAVGFSSIHSIFILTLRKDLDSLMTVAGYPVLRDVDPSVLKVNPHGVPPARGEHAKR